jgi:restriction system protein
VKKYWVIAPYDSSKPDAFEKAWEYDLANGTIAVGWKELGDVSKLSRPELEAKYQTIYPKAPRNIVSLELNELWAFFHEVSLGDIVIARRGMKKIVGIGTVVGNAFHDDQKGQERVSPLKDRYYPNFIGVKWERREIDLGKLVFSRFTMYQISQEKYDSLLELLPEQKKEIEENKEFILERYLEDFIVTNFGRIFGNKLELYKDSEGNNGQQYQTESIGNIDILAKEPSTNSYVVIELKKGLESDTVVGQILRYMGWVKENLCQKGENVKGLIICKDKDKKLDYALKPTHGIEVRLYKVDFHLL